MVRIATHRLVLLSADDDDHVSFDLRSLQELMAGCALVEAVDDTVRSNLLVTAYSPHWRNAWLFAAGRLFSGSDHHRSLVLQLVEECDERGDWHGWLYPAGPELAADMLDDGLASERPADRRRLLAVALRALGGPMPVDTKGYAQKLAAATNTEGPVNDAAAFEITSDRRAIRSALEAAIASSSDGVAYAVASAMVDYAKFGSRIAGQPTAAQFYAQNSVRATTMVGVTFGLGEFLLRCLQDYDPAGYRPSHIVSSALDDCDQIRLYRTGRGELRVGEETQTFRSDAFRAALADADSEAELQIILKDAVPAADWVAVSVLAQHIWMEGSRRPISERLIVD